MLAEVDKQLLLLIDKETLPRGTILTIYLDHKISTIHRIITLRNNKNISADEQYELTEKMRSINNLANLNETKLKEKITLLEQYKSNILANNSSTISVYEYAAKNNLQLTSFKDPKLAVENSNNGLNLLLRKIAEFKSPLTSTTAKEFLDILSSIKLYSASISDADNNFLYANIARHISKMPKQLSAESKRILDAAREATALSNDFSSFNRMLVQPVTSVLEQLNMYIQNPELIVKNAQSRINFITSDPKLFVRDTTITCLNITKSMLESFAQTAANIALTTEQQNLLKDTMQEKLNDAILTVLTNVATGLKGLGGDAAVRSFAFKLLVISGYKIEDLAKRFYPNDVQNNIRLAQTYIDNATDIVTATTFLASSTGIVGGSAIVMSSLPIIGLFITANKLYDEEGRNKLLAQIEQKFLPVVKKNRYSAIKYKIVTALLKMLGIKRQQTPKNYNTNINQATMPQLKFTNPDTIKYLLLTLQNQVHPRGMLVSTVVQNQIDIYKAIMQNIESKTPIRDIIRKLPLAAQKEMKFNEKNIKLKIDLLSNLSRGIVEHGLNQTTVHNFLLEQAPKNLIQSNIEISTRETALSLKLINQAIREIKTSKPIDQNTIATLYAQLATIKSNKDTLTDQLNTMLYSRIAILINNLPPNLYDSKKEILDKVKAATNIEITLTPSVLDGVKDVLCAVAPNSDTYNLVISTASSLATTASNTFSAAYNYLSTSSIVQNPIVQNIVSPIKNTVSQAAVGIQEHANIQTTNIILTLLRNVQFGIGGLGGTKAAQGFAKELCRLAEQFQKPDTTAQLDALDQAQLLSKVTLAAQQAGAMSLGPGAIVALTLFASVPHLIDTKKIAAAVADEFEPKVPLESPRRGFINRIKSIGTTHSNYKHTDNTTESNTNSTPNSPKNKFL